MHDAAAERTARVARVASVTVLIGSLLHIALSMVVVSTTFNLVLAVTGIVASLVCLALLRADRPSAATGTMLTALFGIAVAATLFGGGSQAPAYDVFFVLILFGGFVLGPRAAVSVGGVAVIATAGIAAIEASGALPEPLYPQSAGMRWLTLLTSLVAASGVIWLGLRQAQRDFEQVRDSEQRYRLVTENASDVVWTVDSDLVFTFVSPSAQTVLGFRPEDLVGSRLDADPEVAALLRETIAKQDDFVRYELLHARNGADPVWCEVTGRLRYEAGQLVGITGSTRNIEQRKRGEQRERELERQFLEAQRLEAVGKLAGGIAHDFNNYLTVIIGNAKVLSDTSGDEHATEILDAAERSAALTRQHGSAGEINPGMTPDSFRDSRPDEVVMESVWRLPDDVRLEPGEALVIAHDGTNHRPFSAIDLSGAGFEAFVEASDRDEDNPTVANLESVVYNGGFDWLMTVFGPSVVVLDAEGELGEVPGSFGPLPTVALESVLDGVDTLMDADSASFKRLPDAVDAGFAYADGPYTGTSLHRRSADGQWQDTDDSSEDFEVGDPDPWRPSESDDVFGDPFVEIGTGTTDWVSLDEGDTVELVAGTQGGWHIDASLWFGGFGPGGVDLVYDAVDDAANRVSFVTEAQVVESSVLEADEGWYRVGDRIVLDIGAPAEVVGQDLIVRVTAALGQQTWSDERRVRVVDDE